MITSFIVLFLFVSIFIRITRRFWMLFWVWIDINVILFICYINEDEGDSSDSTLKYFMVQFILSVLIIIIYSFRILNRPGHLSCLLLISFLIIVKLGFTPFHYWMLPIVDILGRKSFFLFLSIQKVIPFMYLFSIRGRSITLISLFIAFSIGLGGFLMFFQQTLPILLTISGSVHRVWISLVNKLFWSDFLFYLLIYFILLIMLLLLGKGDSKSMISRWVVFLSISGFPPLSGFLVKIIIVKSVILTGSIIIFLLTLLSSLLIVVTYMTYIMREILRRVLVYKTAFMATILESFLILLLIF